jgi:hypothetical protein
MMPSCFVGAGDQHLVFSREYVKDEACGVRTENSSIESIARLLVPAARDGYSAWDTL